MIIKGLQKLTLLDFPGRLAATVFTAGCNMRCPFCHNASLVLDGRAGEVITEEEVLAFLDSRRGRLTGLCISGGEPTLQPGLADFIRRVREMGFAVKLDTNGLRPDVLDSLLSEGLLDYVAMDIKNSLDRYPETVGVPGLDTSGIVRSIAMIRQSGVPHEIRTTLVGGLHTVESVSAIPELIGCDGSYFLQHFADSGDLISPDSGGLSPDEFEKIFSEVKKKIPTVTSRG